MKYNVIKLEDRYPLCESLDPNKPWPETLKMKNPNAKSPKTLK